MAPKPPMTKQEIDLFVAEVVHHAPELEHLSDVLRRITVRLVEAGFDVSTRFDISASSVTRSLDGEGGHVRLNPTVGFDALYDLAHELGHLGDPAERADPIEQLRREERAWHRAWEVLLVEDATLAERLEDFERRREECLAGYRADAHAYRSAR